MVKIIIIEKKQKKNKLKKKEEEDEMKMMQKNDQTMIQMLRVEDRGLLIFILALFFH